MPPNSTLRTAGVLSMAHFINDMYANFLPQMIAVLIATQHLKVSDGATLVAAFSVFSSLSQPVFGYLVDQRGQRWLVFVGTLWMSLLLGTTGYISNYYLLLLVSAVAGMGTAAFHPQSMAMMSQISDKHKGFVLASYIAIGNLGLAVSPVLLLPLFHYYGFRYTWLAIIPGILTALLLFFFAPKPVVTNRSNLNNMSKVISDLRKSSLELGKLMLVVATRSLVHTGLMTLLPVYFLSRKFSPEYTGYMVFITLAVGAVGAIIGGHLSDRYGKKRLIVSSLILSSLFFYGFLYTEGVFSIIFLAIGGMALLSTFSVTMIATQEVIPENKALASGLSLGFAVGIGGLAISLVGKFADYFGIASALHLIFILPLFGGLLGLLLKGNMNLDSTQRSNLAKQSF